MSVRNQVGAADSEGVTRPFRIPRHNIEDFSLDRMRAIGRKELDARMGEYRRMLSF